MWCWCDKAAVQTVGQGISDNKLLLMKTYFVTIICETYEFTECKQRDVTL